MKLTQSYIDSIINTALNEDINYIDVTTDNLILPDHTSSAYYIAKDSGVLCGIEIAKEYSSLQVEMLSLKLLSTTALR